VALFGLGGSGMATAQALKMGGAQVVAHDDNPAVVSQASDSGIDTCDLREVDFSDIDVLVLAPGVPLTHPQPHWTVEIAKRHGVSIIGDVELFARERRALAPNSTFIAITGTNGKSTTTALISHILSHSGRNVQMGGNIGRAVLSLDPLSNDAFYVVECSSYQIDLAPSLDPTIGILLNLAPDHLDRHGAMENYAGIKRRLVEASEHAVIGMNDPLSKEIAAELVAMGISVNQISQEPLADCDIHHKDGGLFQTGQASVKKVADLNGIGTLRGAHNGQNAAAAWITCHLAGLTSEEIQNGFATFPGLKHRMELVGSLGKIVYVNDSKATNADAAAKALSSFERIYWIAGGLAKEGGIEALRPQFSRIAKAYLIGEAAPEFAAVFGVNVPFEIAGTMASAVQNASHDAATDPHHEPVVLLSPACASFDQYPNFEVRGEAFRQAVTAIDGIELFKEAS